ncbi:hypothetical protein DXT76_01060 [Halobacillus trueperi]|uniref:Uncharacterized protein n=1 Tax=Halobacillus trueperi TaxID=156205 RepID=A0A3D8VST8_9BACI|nr:hypothetical protein DXT76_01060 [Halobacillus trueperi]
MSIKIGDKNKIKNSKIGHGNSEPPQKKNWASRHPVITSLLSSFVVGFILLFSFWDKVITWVENFFQ